MLTSLAPSPRPGAATVRVLFFGSARIAAGQDYFQLTWEAPGVADDFWSTLAERFPDLKPNRDTIRLARNGEFLRPGEMLRPGDEIALIPPRLRRIAVMIIDVALQAEPLELTQPAPLGAGAVVRFEGRVRPEEKEAVIEALAYEAYEPMAKTQMEKIVRELNELHPCLLVRVRHRFGLVPVGEAAILLEVCARHRAEAFALAAAFMDRVKQEVPIWKSTPKS